MFIEEEASIEYLMPWSVSTFVSMFVSADIHLYVSLSVSMFVSMFVSVDDHLYVCFPNHCQC